jgi:DNA repair protein RadD
MPKPFSIPPRLEKLRACQREAHEAATKHFSGPNPERNVIIQLPTGTGKTALIAALPFNIAKQRVLVLTPNVKLASDMSDELDVIKRPSDNAYRQFSILDKETLESVELYVLKLDSSIAAGDIEEHHIIVSNYHQLQDLEKWFANARESVDLILIDEAHHQAANTYQEIIDFFPNARIVGLTATPFRSDGKKVEGKCIYKYPFNRAIQDGIIRNLLVANVAPKEIELSFVDSNAKKYSLKQILELKEETWFQRGIAMSQDCCDSIARKAQEKLGELRENFPDERHQIVASAISKRHAKEFVRPAFEKLGMKVGLVSSASEDVKTNDETFEKLRHGRIDVIIHIGMLGEGFNHPPLGVAAIFRPYKSLNPYMQFVGRVLRANGTTDVSYIVSHMGLNQLKRFEEFKLFDYDDREFLATLFDETGGPDQAFVEPVKAGLSAKIAQTPIPVIKELGDESLEFGTQFIKPAVAQILDQFGTLNTADRKAFLAALGVDASQITLKTAPRDTRVKPSDKRKADRNLLNSRERSIAIDILNELGLKYQGRDFNRRFPNFAWVIRKVSSLMNAAIGIGKAERKSITNERFKQIEASGLVSEVAKGALHYFRQKL